MKTKHGANIFTDDNRWKFVQIYECFCAKPTLLAASMANLFWHNWCSTVETEQQLCNESFNYWTMNINLKKRKIIIGTNNFFFCSMPAFRLIGKVHCCTLSQTWSVSSNWIKVNPELFVNCHHYYCCYR